MNEHDLQDAILEHLREIAVVKKAVMQTAVKIAADYPTDGAVLLRAIRSLTLSADKLLGDTSVTERPKG